MRVIVVLALLLSATGLASAQAARPVVIEACNEAPFAIGLAVAFRDTPGERRMVRGWFEVAAGDCLEGGLGDMVGDELWIGAVSGEWAWPPEAASQIGYCTPPDTFFGLAQDSDCRDGERLTRFRPQPIRPFRSGWGRVETRFSCEDLPPEDAALCRRTPAGPDGLAAPLRVLEVCNTWTVDAEVSVGTSADFVGFESSGWTRIPATLCRTVYRGFPAGNEVWFAARRADTGHAPRAEDGSLCVANADFTASGARGSFVNAGQCPPEAPLQLPAQRVRFGRNVSHFQHTVPRMDQ